MPGPTPSQPGWYDDGDGRERWYDGNAWTDHVRGDIAAEAAGAAGVTGDTAPLPEGVTAVVPPSSPPPPPPPTGPLSLGPPSTQLEVGGGKGLRVAIGVLGALVLVAVVVVGVLLLVGRGDDDKAPATEDSPTPSVTESSPDAPSSLDIPTIDPSDFPTDAPTEIPTLPSMPSLPSNLPTGFPSDLLGDLPTDPSQIESWFSDYLEQFTP